MKKRKFLVATSLALVMTFGMNMVSFAEELETATEENISEDVPYSLVNYSTEELHTGEEPYELTILRKMQLPLKKQVCPSL